MNVRFGSLADISERIRDVRFTPESGHAERQHRGPLCAISGHPLLPHSSIIGAEPSQLDTGRLAGLDVRISAWTSRSGDHLLVMARLWVWGFRVNVLIPERRGLDHALTLGWRLSRLLLLICSGWVLSLR